MPPRHKVPDQGPKYQNAHAYKANLHSKQSEQQLKRFKELRQESLRGVCKRCCEKVLWKFQYGKYKPKRGIANAKCHECTKPTVNLRYRKLCDACAKESGRCPQCSRNQAEQEKYDREKPRGDGDGASGDEEEENDASTDDEEYEADGIVITRR